MNKPRLLIFTSDTEEKGGGSGVRELAIKVRAGKLNAEIVGVVSNHEHTPVQEIAAEYRIPFYHFPEPHLAEGYQHLVQITETEWVALSGWLKLAQGLEPAKTINIHPGPLPDFGGQGMYGRRVHEVVLEAFAAGRITHSAVSVQFVAPEYDKGPVFFSLPVEMLKDDTPETLEARVNRAEHKWQWWVTNLVVNGQIKLRGKRVKVPDWYRPQLYCPFYLRS
jgi:phosphoribosylglycinamide formyltransferase-1